MSGIPIPAIERIRLLNARQWEEFVLEWVDALRQKYDRVERCGGSGDMGRDVIGFRRDDPQRWDNYQCKHYRTSLKPTDIWIEIGKVVHYSMQGAYTLPESYFFVAPQGVGTKLSNLLRDPEELRAELLANWERYCKDHISSTFEVPLDDPVRAYIDGMDFSLFQAIPPLSIIDDHSKTRWHVARFGGGLPARRTHEPPPSTPGPNESRFIRQLLDAYGDHTGHNIEAPEDLAIKPDLREHFGRARVEFYSAEALRLFSRDTLPPGEFERLHEDFLHGIADQLEASHPDGFRRVEAVLGRARVLPVNDHPLASRVSQKDRGGICHQLANEDQVTWVR